MTEERDGNVETIESTETIMEGPSIEEIERWIWQDGGCLATDGCWVEPDGTCPHGCRSWALVYGLI